MFSDEHALGGGDTAAAGEAVSQRDLHLLKLLLATLRDVEVAIVTDFDLSPRFALALFNLHWLYAFLVVIRLYVLHEKMRK